MPLLAIGLICVVACHAQDEIILSALKVNSMREPISIDDPQPSFSWRVDADGKRGVVVEGYELEVHQLHANGTVAAVWTSGEVKSNQTQFIPWPRQALPLVSDSDYSWQVRAFNPEPTAWSKSIFSTGLFFQSDWEKSGWIQSANTTGKAAQMRKVFTIQPGSISRARAYIALPGFGDVWINGQKVDGRAGTRSLSQYDFRALYHTYDIRNYLRAGEENVIGVYVGVGWFGRPAGGAKFGPPTLRVLLSIQTDGDSASGNEKTVGTDPTWLETPGPVEYEDIYNGTTYDARLETPGWTTPEYVIVHYRACTHTHRACTHTHHSEH
jgi:alpha-L-rhamnosidase